MSVAYLWLWDEVNEVYRKAVGDADGKLIFADGAAFAAEQDTPASLKIALHGWDSVGEVYVPILVNADGKPIIDPTAIFEDPPTNGETTKAPNSNWAFDHDADPAAHHAKYTDAEAEAVADAQIATHTAIATAHQDAPALIATHKAIAAAHHAKYTDAEAKAAAVSDDVYAAGWDGVTDVSPSKNAVYDKIETLGAATKDVFFPVTLLESGSGDTIVTNFNFRVMKMNGTNDSCIMFGKVPHDFTSIVSIAVVMKPTNTDATALIGVIESYYGGVGESVTANNETLTNIATSCVNGDIKEFDVSGVFTNLEAGDLFSLKWTTDDSTSFDILGYVYGIRLRYS